MRSVIFLILFFISVGTTYSQTAKPDLGYGLSFASHEVSKDHRTGLNLNPKEAFYFDEDFEFKFDLAFQRLTNAYGYVVRVIANDSVNIDLVSTPEHNEFHDLTLVVNNKPTDLHFEFSDIMLESSQWTTVTIAFSHTRNEISLRWNDKVKSQPIGVKNLQRFRFYFGVNDFDRFSTSDAPPIILRNVSLNKKNKPVYKWILKEHHHAEVYDSVENARASVANPVWLIDRHTKWIYRKNFTLKRFPSVAFNSDSGILYAIDEMHLYQYLLPTEKLEKKVVKDGYPVFTDANQLVYIKDKSALVNYDLSANRFVQYNFSTDTWPNKDSAYNEPDYWHNNKFYNAFDSSLYTFGGYGHFTYKNDFFRYDNKIEKWIKINTTGSIPPRYLAASGLKPSTNEILIFGGYGSTSGKQELSPQSFYDLYSFDLKTHHVKKNSEFASLHASEDMVFSNSLVVNEAENCFYVLSFPKNKYQSTIKLRQYSLDKNETKVLSDSIPFKFHDEHSICDIFLSEATQELIAVTVHKEMEDYALNVYSISYPPLRPEDVLQPVKPSLSLSTASIVVFIVIAGCGLAGLFFFIVRNKKTEFSVQATPLDLPSSPDTPTVVNTTHEEHKQASAILLFGGFQVFDKSGLDITGKFTMTLKELFTLIILHSIKFEKGISTSVLQEYLWPDKDEVSARNNRNVNIKKLRTLVEEIGKVSIENSNSYLKWNIDDHVFCDYQIVYTLLNSEKTHVIPETERINIILKYAKRGSLLPNLQATWVDNFKSDISNQIIDTLLEYSQKLDVQKDDKQLLEIADAIFYYDSINQEAMVIKCSVLNKKGKYSLAKTWYDHFAKEYKNLYAENYPKTFEEVIS
jgi:DNA-binding SARP family transcriptional activator